MSGGARQRSAADAGLALILLALIVSAQILPALASRAHAAPRPAPHESLLLTSARLSEVRRINVYLPPGYDRCREERYPVLYMLDGGTAEDFPHLASAVDDMIRASRIRPLILVGLENTNRRRDLTGPTAAPEDLQVTSRPGGSKNLREFFRFELQPVVEARYRTTPDRSIVGESLAGLFVVETLLTAPDLFDAYIALDPSLWWNDESLARESAERIAAWPDLPPRRMYLASAGMDGNAASVERLVIGLHRVPRNLLQWHYEPRPELGHSNIYRRIERQFLASMFPTGTHPACTIQN